MKYAKKGFNRHGTRLKPLNNEIIEKSGLYKRLVAHGFGAVIARAECRARLEQNLTIT